MVSGTSVRFRRTNRGMPTEAPSLTTETRLLPDHIQVRFGGEYASITFRGRCDRLQVCDGTFLSW